MMWDELWIGTIGTIGTIGDSWKILGSDRVVIGWRLVATDFTLQSFNSFAKRLFHNLPLSLGNLAEHSLLHFFISSANSLGVRPKSEKMVLEATMIVVDNSESSRNGDYVPSRFDAQADAVNLIYTAKTQANPESSVGLMSMGGAGPEVLTTLTTDMGKILDGIHRTKIRGSSHLSTGINIAALALKHRQNKSQRQRIIVFTCSPIAEDEKSLVKLASRMKKNNICIDVIAFGDLGDENVKKLEAFHEKIKGGDGSHLAVIPPGPNLLSDNIVTTPILQGEGMGGAGGMEGAGEGGEGGSGGGFEFGVDPSMDPELALALRMSLEEEKARQEREKKAREEAEGKTNLEGIKEEDEKQPLLENGAESHTPAGEPSGSGEASGSKEEDKKDGDGDKMDTA